MKSFFSKFFEGSNELALVCGMIGILVILFTPIPPFVLDFLLLLNFCLALMILLVTFHTDKPLSFSTFPSLLLITTLFRLSLNVSATRLILGNASAGKVIESIGTYVVGGNYVIGLVVFLILIVVQYVVVTNGAQRVAEVAARFTLDSLPGKQMSIDADLNMGIIDHEEAKKRRSQLEREANFYGAMDGASKFVKGDAIAGIVIILINIIGGLSIGIVQTGLSWKEALHRYTLLTVGDGIVTQIPSLIIAVAAGIIITRAATDSRLGREISSQFLAHPKAMLIIASSLAAISLLPGVPLLPITALIVIILALAVRTIRTSKKNVAISDERQKLSDSPENETEAQQTNPASFEIVLGSELSESYLNSASEFERRSSNMRRKLSSEMGFQIPTITLRKSKEVPKNFYEIRIFGAKVGSGELEQTSVLAINTGGNRAKLEGKATREPTYGLPATWITPNIAVQARAAGYTVVDSETVLLTHIQELAKKHSPHFMTRLETERLIDSHRQSIGPLIDELVPTLLSYSDVQKVLQALLKENVAIGNMEAIFDALLDSARSTKSADELTEHVRDKLSFQICERMSNENFDMHAITISPELEMKLVGLKQNNSTLPHPSQLEMDKLVSQVSIESERMLKEGKPAIILCSPTIRRLLRNLLARTIPSINVISATEISDHVRVISFAIVGKDDGHKGSKS